MKRFRLKFKKPIGILNHLILLMNTQRHPIRIIRISRKPQYFFLKRSLDIMMIMKPNKLLINILNDLILFFQYINKMDIRYPNDMTVTVSFKVFIVTTSSYPS